MNHYKHNPHTGDVPSRRYGTQRYVSPESYFDDPLTRSNLWVAFFVEVIALVLLNVWAAS